MASPPSFGKWLIAATVVVAGVAMLEQWDDRLAYLAAFMILLAVFFRYPAAMSEIKKIFAGS